MQQLLYHTSFERNEVTNLSSIERNKSQKSSVSSHYQQHRHKRRRQQRHHSTSIHQQQQQQHQQPPQQQKTRKTRNQPQHDRNADTTNTSLRHSRKQNPSKIKWKYILYFVSRAKRTKGKSYRAPWKHFHYCDFSRNMSSGSCSLFHKVDCTSMYRCNSRFRVSRRIKEKKKMFILWVRAVRCGMRVGDEVKVNRRHHGRHAQAPAYRTHHVIHLRLSEYIFHRHMLALCSVCTAAVLTRADCLHALLTRLNECQTNGSSPAQFHTKSFTVDVHVATLLIFNYALWMWFSTQIVGTAQIFPDSFSPFPDLFRRGESVISSMACAQRGFDTCLHLFPCLRSYPHATSDIILQP